MCARADLHRYDTELLAGFFADCILKAIAGIGQSVFWQIVDDFADWRIF